MNLINLGRTVYIENSFDGGGRAGRCSGGVPSRRVLFWGARRKQQRLRIMGRRLRHRCDAAQLFPGVENEQAYYLGSISRTQCWACHLCIHSRGARIEMKPEPKEARRRQ